MSFEMHHMRKQKLCGERNKILGKRGAIMKFGVLKASLSLFKTQKRKKGLIILIIYYTRGIIDCRRDQIKYFLFELNQISSLLNIVPNINIFEDIID